MEHLLAQLEALTEEYRGQTVVSAKRLQNPLLELHTAAAEVGDTATAPIEALLTATTTRTMVAVSELDELADSVRRAAVGAPA